MLTAEFEFIGARQSATTRSILSLAGYARDVQQVKVELGDKIKKCPCYSNTTIANFRDWGDTFQNDKTKLFQNFDCGYSPDEQLIFKAETKITIAHTERIKTDTMGYAESLTPRDVRLFRSTCANH